ncbi:MAG: hypothetical protein DRP12_00085 [Candidatus Aenigmatarchaeota archaeon]|nr:MAG: hypothetical protein DRP12_00085 [Candidatus Aenigmarchaeota archaeon]
MKGKKDCPMESHGEAVLRSVVSLHDRIGDVEKRLGRVEGKLDIITKVMFGFNTALLLALIANLLI